MHKQMKKTQIFLASLAIMMIFSSCNVWNNMFKPKYGCGTNGKNVGAEKLISGDPDTMKAVRKAKKFKS